MAPRFSNIQTFIRDVVRPYVKNLVDLFKAESKYTETKLGQLEAQHATDVTMLQTNINQVDLKATNTQNSLNTHVNTIGNPHGLKMLDLVTVSSQPAPATGTPGTFWFQVLPPNQ